MKAAIYARYSSDNQRAASIGDQARNCLTRAKVEGWRIVHQYADEAITGSDASRPQYQAMLAAAGRGEFDILLIDDLSRLARDSVEQERTIRRLEFQGLRIIATSDGYDSESKARKVHRGFKGLMNEIFIDDLREKVHRGQTGQAIKGRWNGGRPYGYKLRPILDASQLDPYGQPARIGTVLEVDPAQAEIVQEIFSRFVEGASCLTISRELNARSVPSPGSTWKRKTRRCSGWMASAVRVILKNPLYTGCMRWNVSQFVRDPDSGKHKRRARPQAEWIKNQDESLRVISDALFEQAQTRTRVAANGDERLKSGGKAKYLLSGLLVCNVCKAHYVIANDRSYACSGHWNGRTCKNNVRVRRDAIEAAILNPIRKDLLTPERVEKMAREMQALYAARLKATQARIEVVPRELQELNARLERLRERLKKGDPDMPPDELQAAIDRVEVKRRELEAAQPEAKQTARVLSMLPRAAEIYRKQIALGLDGDPRAALKARVILRDLLGGKIRLLPEKDGSLWAEYGVHPAVLLRAVGTSGRGERI